MLQSSASDGCVITVTCYIPMLLCRMISIRKPRLRSTCVALPRVSIRLSLSPEYCAEPTCQVDWLHYSQGSGAWINLALSSKLSYRVYCRMNSITGNGWAHETQTRHGRDFYRHAAARMQCMLDPTIESMMQGRDASGAQTLLQQLITAARTDNRVSPQSRCVFCGW
jgi:hypothetical protein